MASKKPAAARKAAVKPKAVQTATAIPIAETPQPDPAAAASFSKVWTIPFALLMLVMAAGALWLAVRESSNAPQAATPAVTREVMRPDGPSNPAPKTPAASAAAPKKVDSAPPPVDGAKPVSVTGCLQKTDSGFVLKNTEGAEAPKSRSWKSGFLKHSNASIDLDEASSAAHLSSHVGERVSVTGPLVDRQMTVQSVHRVAAACQ
jgi:hypothetical protein